MLLAEEHAAAEAVVSYVPLLTSVLVSLGGLALGYLTYRGFSSAEAKDPAQRVTGAWYWNVLQNRYGMDEFYQRGIYQPVALGVRGLYLPVAR